MPSIRLCCICSYACVHHPLFVLSQGLHSLHAQSVLHRDIKPKNVFLTGKNHVRLGDLGCAKLMKGGLARTQIGERL